MVSLSKFKKQGQHICTEFFDYNEAFDTASTGLCLQCPKIINFMVLTNRSSDGLHIIFVHSLNMSV